MDPDSGCHRSMDPDMVLANGLSPDVIVAIPGIADHPNWPGPNRGMLNGLIKMLQSQAVNNGSREQPVPGRDSVVYSGREPCSRSSFSSHKMV